MFYALSADFIVAVHVAYVSFVILGELAILLGLALRWKWVRNPWFRLLHLTAIVIVAGEALLSIQCPLTVWEAQLRELAGQKVAGGTFIGRCMDSILFYQLPPRVFTICYVSFAVLVLATLVLAPPRWKRAQVGSKSPSSFQVS
jgi:hypothetical protein